MLDIVHALEWVRDNIAEFGGDAGNVTVFGQSGGGRKVATLLAMPSAKGLFHRAIIESGATIQLVEREQGARVARELLQELGLEPRQWRELQSVPLATLMSAYFATVRRMNVDQMTMGFSPTVDGTAVAQHPFHPQAAAVSADVPLMHRLHAHRADVERRCAPTFSLDEAGMRARVGELLGDSASRVIDVYARANPGASPSDLYFLIASDQRYGAPVMKIAERRAALGKAPVYLYYFRWETPLEGGRARSAAHDRDSVRVRQRRGFAADARRRPDAPALADQGQRRVDRVRPHAAIRTRRSLPRWPAFDAGERATMVFNEQQRRGRTTRCVSSASRCSARWG